MTHVPKEAILGQNTLASELVELCRQVGSHGSTSLRTAWARHVNTDPESPEFLESLAATTRKFRQLRTEIEAAAMSDRARNHLLGAVDTLSRYATTPMLGQPSSVLGGQTQAFEYLELMNDLLTPLEGRDLDKKTIKDLTAEANALLTSLNAVDMDPRLKAFLALQISNLIWALRSHHVLGIDGVSRTFGAVAAEMSRAQGMQGAAKPAAKSWFKQAGRHIKNIGIGLAVVTTVVDKADNLLTDGLHLAGLITGGEENDAASDS
jgi:hypothetical protein